MTLKDLAARGNAIALAILHGRERMFVCLGVCVLDVTANAVIIALVTRAPNRTITPPSEMCRLDRHHVVPTAGLSGPEARAQGPNGEARAPTEQWKIGPSSAFGGLHWLGSVPWRRDAGPGTERTMDLASISVHVQEDVVVEDGTADESGSTPKRPEPTLSVCTWTHPRYGCLDREWEPQPFRAMVVPVRDANKEEEVKPRAGAGLAP